MKKINLIPNVIKREKMLSNSKKIIFYCLVLLILAFVYTKYNLNQIDSKINSYNSIVKEDDKLQQEIERLTSEINITKQNQETISKSSFPYHRFLYFLTSQSPNDVRILTIESMNPNEDKVNNEIPIEEGKNNEISEDEQLENSEGMSSPLPGQTTQSGENIIEEQFDVTEEIINKERSTPFTNDPSIIRIIGYAKHPDSIPILREKLLSLDFISDVMTPNITNYFTGKEHYKVFEMEVHYE